MKAILYTQYGSADKLEYKDVEKPTPNENQVLVRVLAASVNAMEWRRFTAPLIARMIGGGLRKPKNTAIGADIAGRVEAVGANVTRFKPGDEVFGAVVGGFAEYVCTTERNLARKPANIPFEVAAAVPVAGLTALQGLRDRGQIQAGQKVLVYGASGGVGIFTVQIAKHFGAEVTAVCSTRNVEMVRSLGADHVLDYTKQDFSRSGQKYDLIATVNGSHSIFKYTRALKPGGIYVGLGGSLAQMSQAFVLGKIIVRLSSLKISNMLSHVKMVDLDTLSELLAAGVITPIIDRHYPLKETPAALRYVIEEHARGKVIITMA